jgi:3-oxoacyl-[acyl-carrier-protein] synthase-3
MKIEDNPVETRFRSVGIAGSGFYVPKKVLTNFDLEKMVDTTDEWIRTRTGVRERRIANDNEATSDLAVEAARKALEDARISPQEIDLIIVATLSPDYPFPSTACLVQDKLGIKDARAFDVEAACSAFIYALSVAEAFIKTGACKTALVIGSEVFSRIVDWEDRNSCILMGDGAGAVVLKETENGKGILSTHLGADGSGAALLKQPAGGSRLPASEETVRQGLHYFKMQGNEVFKLAVRIMSESVITALKKAGLSNKDIDLIIPHQANIRILNAMTKRLSLPMEKLVVNLDKYGNTTAASIPIALDEASKQGRIKEGDIVVLVAFGAGLTWGAAVIRW